MANRKEYYEINNFEFEFIRRSKNKCSNLYNDIIKHNTCNKEIEIFHSNFIKHSKSDFKNYQCPYCKNNIHNPEFKYIRRSKNKSGEICNDIIKHNICNKEIEMKHPTFTRNFKSDFKNYQCPYCKINNKNISNPEFEYIRKSENKCGTSYNHIIKHNICNKEIELQNETFNRHFKSDFKNYQCPYCKNNNIMINNPEYDFIRKIKNKSSKSYNVIIKHNTCNKEIKITNSTFNKHFKSDFKNYKCPHCKNNIIVNNTEFEYIGKSKNKCGNSYNDIIKHNICNKEIEMKHPTFNRHFKSDFKNYQCPYCNDKTKINNTEFEYIGKSKNKCFKSYNHIIKHNICNKEIEIANTTFTRHFKSDFKNYQCPHCNDKTKINNTEFEYIGKSKNKCGESYNYIIKHNICNKEIEIANTTFTRHFKSDFKNYQCPHCITFSRNNTIGFRNKIKSHYKCLSYEYTGRNNLEYFKFIDMNTDEIMVLNNYQLNDIIKKEEEKKST